MRTLILAIAALAAGCERTASAGDRAPNVLLIAAEGLEVDAIGDATPAIVALRRGGVRLDATGAIGPRISAVATGFRAAGYATAVAGRDPGTEVPLASMFGDSCLLRSSANTRLWGPEIWRDRVRSTHPDDVFGPDVCAEFVADFLRDHSGARFAYYATSLPAPGARMPGEAGDTTDSVAYLDAIVGKLVAAAGDRTVVVFCAGSMRRRVFVRWPGRIPDGPALRDAVTAEELEATLLDLAGLPVEGRGSLLPRLLGGVETESR